MKLQTILEVLLVIQCTAYVVLCPYTKVEESFNLQAIHDILYHGTDLEKYDHQEFPGVVPRSFIGPLAVSALSAPLVYAGNMCGGNKLLGQYIVRSVLGCMVCLSLISFLRVVSSWLGPLVSTFAILLTMAQFHFLFYASRTLPNTFALALVMLALRFRLLHQYRRFLWTSGATILVFRTETAILLGLCLLIDLAKQRLSLWDCLSTCIPAGVALIGVTVLVDSYFWHRWLWPEGEVFWYNAILNKSSQWGTSPFLWYFYSTLPRGCLLSIPLAVWGGVRERRVWDQLGPALLFVLLFSLLPHKELRFIVHVFPVINVVAATGAANLWRRQNKLHLPVRLLLVCSMLVSLLVSLCFLGAAALNYPGGEAMAHLHQMASPHQLQSPVTVHIDVEPAQTGVSRFTELQPRWSYLKTEGLKHGSAEMLSFDFLLTSVANTDRYKNTHNVLAVIHAFGGIKGLDLRDVVNSLSKPTLVILQKL